MRSVLAEPRRAPVGADGRGRLLNITEILGPRSRNAVRQGGRRRIVALPSRAVEALRHAKAEQAKIRLLVGSAYQDQGLIFADRASRLLDPDRATRGIAALCRKAGLSRIRFHDLRHSHASMLLEAGVGVRVVADRLSHVTPTLTLNTYAHVLSGQDADAAARLEAALRAAGGARPTGG